MSAGTLSAADVALDTVSWRRAVFRLYEKVRRATDLKAAHDPAWACPLAPTGNTVDVEIPVGERYGDGRAVLQ